MFMRKIILGLKTKDCFRPIKARVGKFLNIELQSLCHSVLCWERSPWLEYPVMSPFELQLTRPARGSHPLVDWQLWAGLVHKLCSKRHSRGLPWWRSGWESACQCRGHGFEPWSGKIPHAAEQLGPWATTAEPARLEPVLRNKRGHDSERPAHHDEEWSPLATTRESPHTETKTQHSQKLKLIN